MTGRRKWSYLLANWARWSEAHLHSITAQAIEDYAAFAEIAFACIRRKTIRLVGPELPPWSREHSVRRAWKLALRHAGKARILAVLAPLVIEVLAEVREEDLGDPRHLDRYGSPRARAASAARAAEALRTGGPHANVALHELDASSSGMLRPAAARISAARALVQAMASKTKMSVDAMGCLDNLAQVRPDLLERVAAAL
ncbi:MAG: hypothetical protein ACTHU0_08225 [Kofleriaceae bacterium]